MGVGGCWAQSVKEEVFERFPFVDVAFGPGQVHRLAEFLTSDSLTAQGYFEFEGFTGHLPARRDAAVPGVGADQRRLQLRLLLLHRALDARARGQPAARGARRGGARDGRRRGARGHAARAERQLLRARPAPGRRRASFAELLGALDGIEGIERIRYTSPHPKDMREDVIRAHAELAACASTSTCRCSPAPRGILKAMRRTYDRERYLDRVALIREHVPDVALTTDIIVGFPGETEEDFAQTLEVVEQVGYDGAFTFIFSPRRGTEAAALTEGLVPHPVKVERMERLVEVVQRRARERAQRFVGRTLEVLVEGPSRTDPERLRGRTRHNKVVNFTGLAAPGELTEVRDRLPPPARRSPARSACWHAPAVRAEGLPRRASASPRRGPGLHRRWALVFTPGGRPGRRPGAPGPAGPPNPSFRSRRYLEPLGAHVRARVFAPRRSAGGVPRFRPRGRGGGMSCVDGCVGVVVVGVVDCVVEAPRSRNRWSGAGARDAGQARRPWRARRRPSWRRATLMCSCDRTSSVGG